MALKSLSIRNFASKISGRAFSIRNIRAVFVENEKGISFTD